MQRAPDGLGLSHWINDVGVNGRAATLNGFKGSTEYRELAGTLYRETFWMVGDHLGTPRMVVDRSGSLAGVKRHDYLPFGEELSVGGRTTAQGYGVPDDIRQQWHTLERDDETGLDFAQARYYSSIQGRFTSVDPAMSSGRITIPQSWDRYSYSINNPLAYSDPTGLDWYRHKETNRVKWFTAGQQTDGFEAYTPPNNQYNTADGRNSVTLFANGPDATAAVGSDAYNGFSLGAPLPDNSALSLSTLAVPAGIAMADSPAPGPADIVALIAAIGIIATMPDPPQVALPPSVMLPPPIMVPILQNTLEPGQHAGDSIPARGPGRDFTPDEREDINEIGGRTGCHTCGTTNPGTRSGDFIPDHQPPNALNPNGNPQRLYPHCIGCSRTQGGQVRSATRGRR